MVHRAVASSDFTVIGIWPTLDDRQQTDGEFGADAVVLIRTTRRQR
jgi:hypothetical protein